MPTGRGSIDSKDSTECSSVADAGMLRDVSLSVDVAILPAEALGMRADCLCRCRPAPRDDDHRRAVRAAGLRTCVVAERIGARARGRPRRRTAAVRRGGRTAARGLRPRQLAGGGGSARRCGVAGRRSSPRTERQRSAPSLAGARSSQVHWRTSTPSPGRRPAFENVAVVCAGNEGGTAIRDRGLRRRGRDRSKDRGPGPRRGTRRCGAVSDDGRGHRADRARGRPRPGTIGARARVRHRVRPAEGLLCGCTGGCPLW